MGSDGKLEWVKPEFDDSGWESVDLKPAEGANDPTTGIPRYVPGWTARGHRGYWGYAWYRLRVELHASPGEKLGVQGPSDVDDAYEVYANGDRLGSFGDFSNPKRPRTYNTQPRMFLLPEPMERQTGDVKAYVLAFRVWMESATSILVADAGGIHTAPQLGEASAVTFQHQIAWLQISRGYALTPVQALLSLLLAVISLSLTLFDREDPVYFWLAGVLLAIALNAINLMIQVWTEWQSLSVGALVMIDVLRPLILTGWLMVWWVWFRLRKPVWMPKLIAVLAALFIIMRSIANQDLMIFQQLPQAVVTAAREGSVGMRLCFLSLLLCIVFKGTQQQGREGWLAVPAVMLMGISQFQEELNALHIRTIWFPFGAQLTLGTISSLMLIAAMFGLLMRRLLFSVRRQRAMALDVQHAKEIQGVLLPEVVSVPGLEITCEYRPALEVGGDFFQIVPHETDGSVLIVAGDVTGKGLQAGMMVALLVGGIRSTAEVDADPGVVLAALNRRLLGRGEVQATCLALRIAADGRVKLANAGHLAPYIDGVEVAMEGALPLGMMEGAEFPEMEFELSKGAHLLLISDGIPEAQDKHGPLFGFERVVEFLRDRKSAAELASEAQTFGQSDDISVVSVIRAD